MTAKARLKRLEAARRPRRKVTTYDLDALTEDEVQAVAVIEGKVNK